MGDPFRTGVYRNALMDARCPLSGASGDCGAPRPFFGGRGDACGGGRLLRSFLAAYAARRTKMISLSGALIALAVFVGPSLLFSVATFAFLLRD